MTDYKATPEQWAQVEAWMAIESEYSACVIELRARVEALEAANDTRRIDIIRLANAVANQVSDRTKFFTDVTPDDDDDDDCQSNEEADIVDYYAALAAQHQGRAVFHKDPKPTSNDHLIRSSLVERVRNVIASEHDPKDYCWDEARAAIREVAAWLKEHGYAGWSVLQQEAER